MACCVCGSSRRAVVQVLGVSEHAVGKQRRRLARRMTEDADLRLRLDQIAQRYQINVYCLGLTLLALGLSGRAQSLEVRLQEATGNRLSHAEFLELILQDELNIRHERLR